jgi:hypothetical protein
MRATTRHSSEPDQAASDDHKAERNERRHTAALADNPDAAAHFPDCLSRVSERN